MSQLPFLFFLYLIGTFPALFMRTRVRTEFLAWTAFAWGALAWVISSVLCLLLGVPFLPENILLMLLLLAALLALYYRRRLRLFGKDDLRVFLIPAAVFVIVVSTMAVLNVAQSSPDTIKQLMIANKLAKSGLQSDLLPEFGFWGVALLMLQAPARWLGLGYFSAMQSAFGVTLIGSFHCFCRAGLMRLGVEPSKSTLATMLATVLLLSTPFVLFQFYYVHNNFIAATFLFIGVVMIWWAWDERYSAHLGLGVLALLGFSLSRTETMLFATVFLVPALTIQNWATHMWLKRLLPFALLLATWYLWLLLGVTPETKILTTERILVILAVVVGSYAVPVVSDVHIVKKSILPYLHRIMLGTFVIILVAIMLREPGHLPRVVWVFFANLGLLGLLWWGGTWWLLAALLALAVPKARAIPGERLFTVGITGFFLLIAAISYVHNFRIAWADSANRAFTHILPIVAYYVTLKVAPVFFSTQQPMMAETTPA